MTRINVGIPPKQLTRLHLLAEHREIKRIPNAVKLKKANLKDIPAHFTLGTGHVKFFYNKLGYLLDRYKQLRDECLARGYNIEDYSGCWFGLDRGIEWQPSELDIQLIQRRIDDRLSKT